MIFILKKHQPTRYEIFLSDRPMCPIFARNDFEAREAALAWISSFQGSHELVEDYESEYTHHE